MVFNQTISEFTECHVTAFHPMNIFKLNHYVIIRDISHSICVTFKDISYRICVTFRDISYDICVTFKDISHGKCVTFKYISYAYF